ncbi:hypothetical protein AMTR_s00095p00175380, partial [Amborella trichopoda]
AYLGGGGSMPLRFEWMWLQVGSFQNSLGSGGPSSMWRGGQDIGFTNAGFLMKTITNFDRIEVERALMIEECKLCHRAKVALEDFLCLEEVSWHQRSRLLKGKLQELNKHYSGNLQTNAGFLMKTITNFDRIEVERALMIEECKLCHRAKVVLEDFLCLKEVSWHQRSR